MIILDEARTIAIWYTPLNKELDFMGCLQRPEDPTKSMSGKPRDPDGYDFDYRFRYYKDDQAFNSEDEKHWYHVEIHAMPVVEVLEKIRLLTKMLARMNDHEAQLSEIVNDGDWKKFIDTFRAQPWAHMKAEKVSHA